jgi:hypothetical protein
VKCGCVFYLVYVDPNTLNIADVVYKRQDNFSVHAQQQQTDVQNQDKELVNLGIVSKSNKNSKNGNQSLDNQQNMNQFSLR